MHVKSIPNLEFAFKEISQIAIKVSSVFPSNYANHLQTALCKDDKLHINCDIATLRYIAEEASLCNYLISNHSQSSAIQLLTILTRSLISCISAIDPSLPRQKLPCR